MYLGTILDDPQGNIPLTPSRHLAISLHHVKDVAMAPKPTKHQPEHIPRDHGSTHTNEAPKKGPNRAILHVTMAPVAQLAENLGTERHLVVVEGNTNDIVVLAMYTIAVVRSRWHPVHVQTLPPADYQADHTPTMSQVDTVLECLPTPIRPKWTSAWRPGNPCDPPPPPTPRDTRPRIHWPMVGIRLVEVGQAASGRCIYGSRETVGPTTKRG